MRTLTLACLAYLTSCNGRNLIGENGSNDGSTDDGGASQMDGSSAGDGGTIGGPWGWTTLSSGTASDLYATWNDVGTGRIFVVGSNETVLVSSDDGDSWTVAFNPNGGKGTLHGIWGDPTGALTTHQIYLVGGNVFGGISFHDGFLLRSSDSGMTFSGPTEIGAGGVAGHNALWGSSRDNLVVVGNDSTIYYGARNSWGNGTFPPNTPTSTIYGIWGNAGPGSGQFLVAVGGVNSADVFRSTDNGQNWALQALAGAPLHGIWAIDWNRLYAVGSAGEVLRSTDHGQSWTPQQSQTSADLLAIDGAPGADFYVVGASGTIFHQNTPGTWSSEPSGTNNDLLGVRVAEKSVFAVGKNGTILRKRFSQPCESAACTADSNYCLDGDRPWGAGTDQPHLGCNPKPPSCPSQPTCACVSQNFSGCSCTVLANGLVSLICNLGP